MNKIVILGCRFVGISLMPFLEKAGYEVYASSRKPLENELLKNHPNHLKFNLEDKSTYQNIPENADIVWTFPAVPVDNVSDFLTYLKQKNCRVRVVLGTTSAYTDKQGILTENSQLDTESPRIKGENLLMENGTVVLQLAGIYSEERHPFNWLNKGLIKNSNKTINLIHVNDICNIISKVLKSDLKGERFILSDGNKYWWRDIWKTGKERNKVRVDCPPKLEIEDRQVSNLKLKEFMGTGFQFSEL
jgi:nucleoside-diphosphate-sugar epimerase